MQASSRRLLPLSKLSSTSLSLGLRRSGTRSSRPASFLQQRQSVFHRLGARSFQTSSARLADAVAAPVRKPVGAFRGGLFGFLLGTALAGASVYYYILEEYRVSNELLTEDIYSLQAAVQRTEAYVRSLEEKIQEVQKQQ